MALQYLEEYKNDIKKVINDFIKDKDFNKLDKNIDNIIIEVDRFIQNLLDYTE